MNPMTPRDDELSRFYRDHAGRVLGWAIRLGGSRVDAEDIAHDVFAVAVRRLREFRGEAETTTWLFAITRKVVANARRRAAVRQWVGLDSVPELPSDVEGADEQLASRRRRVTVQRALDRLPRAQREAVALVDLEGLSAVDASALLGVPVEQDPQPGECVGRRLVTSRLHTARRALATALERERFAAGGPVVAPAAGRA